MKDIAISLHELAAGQQAAAGGKGTSLARLLRIGAPVPAGFVIVPEGFDGDDLAAGAWSAVRKQLESLRGADDEVALAVRSSASSEDSTKASFAGGFETVLNVRSDEEVRAAIRTVYGSLQSERVQAYRQSQGMNEPLQMSVIVQRLVQADCSGILFTANPVTGERDKAMISAAWGLGEAIVGGEVTPDTLLVDKDSGRIVSREVAVKRVMTVLSDGDTENRRVPERMQRRAVLTQRNAAELVRLGVEIESDFGQPMDIEWAIERGEIAILQARPITALPDPPAPTRFRLPKGSWVAMRNNIVELMANPLSPLFRTLGLEAVNASMHRLLDAFFGSSRIMPEQIIMAVNGYAYYNGSITVGQIIRMILGAKGILKRMLVGAVERWTVEGRPRYVQIVDALAAQDWRARPGSEVLAAVRQLAEAAIDAYGALVSGVLPAAWMSEALFTATYRLLIKRRGEPQAPTFLLGFDSLPTQAEKALFDLALWCRQRPAIVDYLLNTPSALLADALREDPATQAETDRHLGEWRRVFQSHLDRFGHTLYDLDFSHPLPADDPTPLLDTLKMFLGGGGADPRQRQREAVERRDQASESIRARLRGWRLRTFTRTLEAAQRFAPMREDGLADVGLGYPLLRRLLRILGDRLVVAGAIERPQDIYWLTGEELTQLLHLLDAGSLPEPKLGAVLERRAQMRAAREASPPLALPQLPRFDRKLRAGRRRGKRARALKGVAASPGRATAPASVLHGPQDFGQMRSGDVLVAPITTPAWTPLFARASAIVTDVGGPLSHGSIVAREYGIPAVLGTREATKRISSGQRITVNGTDGEVVLAEGSQPPSEHA